MKSMLNGFHECRRRQPVTAPWVGGMFRELTHQETSTVAGGIFKVIGLAIDALRLKIPTEDEMVTNFELLESWGVPTPRIK